MENIGTILGWVDKYGLGVFISVVFVILASKAFLDNKGVKKRMEDFVKEQTVVQTTQAQILSNLIDTMKPQAETLKEIVMMIREAMQASQEALLELAEMKRLYQSGYLEEVTQEQAATILSCAIKVSQLRVVSNTLDLVNLDISDDEKLVNEKINDICELAYNQLRQDLGYFKHEGRYLSMLITKEWLLRTKPIVRAYLITMPPRDCKDFMRSLENKLTNYHMQLIENL